MLTNYLKTAWRNLTRNGIYSFITITGLAIGLCACLLILLYVSHEKSYDKFHADSGRIFKVEVAMSTGDMTLKLNGLNPAVGPMAIEGSPEVVSAARIVPEHETLVVTNPDQPNSRYSEAAIRYADANFFSFFSFDLYEGDTKTALQAPFSLVISRAMAKKYFGESEVIGKTLEIKKASTYTFTVTGVMENTRSNSSIPTDFVASFESLPAMKEYAWHFENSLFRPGSFPTYLKITDPAARVRVEHTLNDLARQADADQSDTYTLRNLEALHLESEEGATNKYLALFSGVALLILLLALINYLSLSTARASLRSLEIGVRKVNGASRAGVAIQFYLESSLQVFLAFVIASGLTFFLQPVFFGLLNIRIDAAYLVHPGFLLIASGLFAGTILLAGLYPALFMASMNPVVNLKNKVSERMRGFTLRQVCTVVQFTAAVALMISGLVIREQIRHMRKIDTGLNRSDVLMIPVHKTMGPNATAFKNELAGMAPVQQIALAGNVMYDGYPMFFATSQTQQESTALPTFSVDRDFFETLEIGWKVPPQTPTRLTDGRTIAINETAIREFNLPPNPVGQKLLLGNTDYEVVAVTRDFHFSGLDSPVQPLGMLVSGGQSDGTGLPVQNGGCLYLKYRPNTDLSDLLGRIEKQYARFDQETPFAYEFMDDAFDATFRSEQRLGIVFNLFLIITLFIAGMGLFGLAAFTAQQKVKEIGVRKVLGASVYQITALISRSFIRLVLIAIVLALPIAGYFMHLWLQDFTYRTDMPWYLFAVAAVFTLFITVLTVGFETVRAALANPVKSLRSE